MAEVQTWIAGVYQVGRGMTAGLVAAISEVEQGVRAMQPFTNPRRLPRWTVNSATRRHSLIRSGLAHDPAREEHAES